MYSDAKLNLAPRWFTGSQWKDGTAERELQREYREATDALHRSRAHRHDDAEMKKRFREVAGLPPLMAAKRLMGRY